MCTNKIFSFVVLILVSAILMLVGYLSANNYAGAYVPPPMLGLCTVTNKSIEIIPSDGEGTVAVYVPVFEVNASIDKISPKDGSSTSAIILNGDVQLYESYDRSEVDRISDKFEIMQPYKCASYTTYPRAYPPIDEKGYFFDGNYRDYVVLGADSIQRIERAKELYQNYAIVGVVGSVLLVLTSGTCFTWYIAKRYRWGYIILRKHDNAIGPISTQYQTLP